MWDSAGLTRFVRAVLAVAALAVLLPKPAQAQAQVINQKFRLPFEEVFSAAEYPCLTEDVRVYGTLPMQTRTIIDGRGGLHLQFHDRADLTAEGSSTGDTYHTQGPAVDVVYDFDNDPSTPSREVYHNLVHVVGPGRDGNVLFRWLFHVVVNARGVQTVSVDRFEMLCH